MEAFVLAQIAEDWDRQSSVALTMQEMSLPRMQQLLKETYEVLTAYHRQETIPKEVAKILLNMEDFLYFISMIEEKEKGHGYYYWEELYNAINAMRAGFFAGFYPCEYPMLSITDCLDNTFLFDLEHGNIQDYIALFRQVKAQED